MSIVLYVLGILSVIAGLAAIAFGIPVKEFSFGNTLIVAGVTGFVGGLIVVGLGAVVTHLSRAVEMLGARPLQRMSRPLESFEAAAGPARVPFPTKPKSDAKPAAEMPVFPPRPVTEETKPDVGAPPTLPNPDVASAPEPEMAPASRPAPAAPETPAFPVPPKIPSRFAAAENHGSPPFEPFKRDTVKPSEPAVSVSPAPEPDAFGPPLEEPASPEPPRSSWRSPRPDRPSFDDLWPAESSRSAEPSRAESIPRVNEPAPGLKVEAETPYEPVQAVAPEAPPEPEVQPVPILKSGVVDGMGYTLYVDGSIEAELPDGTLRFASINELRAHLERNA
ncbi:MAG: hypothetical protein OJF62_003083 [Pseudolabrys sp.]|jgi:hypothetical protein|nr:hypothetical protein [Pseudolabrys sp.]